MAANQRNFEVFTYVDNDAVTWNKRGTLDTAINAIDGSSTLTGGAPLWPKRTRRYHTREAIFFDPVTFRTARFPVYTAAAFAAITGATTVAISVPNSATPVTYSLSQKIDEKKPVAKTTRKDTDHP